MKLRKYRIVRDNFNGYEAQVWRFWFPFWVQCFGSNTKKTLEESKKVIERHKAKPIYVE